MAHLAAYFDVLMIVTVCCYGEAVVYSKRIASSWSSATDVVQVV